MITVKSLRGGVTIPGFDENGLSVNHEFTRKNQTKKYKKVDADVLKQGVKLGWIVFSGKEEDLPKERAIENSQHNFIELQDAVSDALDASIAAREELAEAKQRLAGLATPSENDSDQVKKELSEARTALENQVGELEKAMQEKGEAYEKAKAELAKA